MGRCDGGRVMAWIDKYAPKNRSELLTPQSPVVVKIIDKLFKGEDLPYRALLFYDTLSNGGTSKSTLIDLYLSQTGIASLKIPTTGATKKDLEDFSIDIRRNLDMALSFGDCKIPNLENKLCVVGNEISKSSTDFVDGLRDLIDNYKSEVIWLFADNHFATLTSKSPQMFSNQRVLTLNWDNIPVEKIRERCIEILQLEGKNTSANREILDSAIKTHGVSIRGVLQELETFYE